MKLSRLSWTVALAGVALMAATPAVGFELIGNKWCEGTRNVVVDSNGEDSVTDGDNGVTAVTDGVPNWNINGVGNLVTTSLEANPDPSPSNGTSTMVFSDPLRICTGSCLAVTTVGFTTGQTQEFNGVTFNCYEDSDIYFNERVEFTSEEEPDGCTTSPPKKAEFFIEGIAVHEVGHLLGLGHTSVGGATMFASVNSCDNSPESLAADDEAGIGCIYDSSASCGGGGPCEETVVSASTSTSCNSNGRNAMTVTVNVSSDCGAKAGVDVTVVLTGSCGSVLSGTAPTGSDGSVTFALRKSDAETGPYDVDVTVADPLWDESGDTTSCFVTNANSTCL